VRPLTFPDEAGGSFTSANSFLPLQPLTVSTAPDCLHSLLYLEMSSPYFYSPTSLDTSQSPLQVGFLKGSILTTFSFCISLFSVTNSTLIITTSPDLNSESQILMSYCIQIFWKHLIKTSCSPVVIVLCVNVARPEYPAIWPNTSLDAVILYR
jgi:hypothetical protein